MYLDAIAGFGQGKSIIEKVWVCQNSTNEAGAAKPEECHGNFAEFVPVAGVGHETPAHNRRTEIVASEDKFGGAIWGGLRKTEEGGDKDGPAERKKRSEEEQKSLRTLTFSGARKDGNTG